MDARMRAADAKAAPRPRPGESSTERRTPPPRPPRLRSLKKRYGLGLLLLTAAVVSVLLLLLPLRLPTAAEKTAGNLAVPGLLALETGSSAKGEALSGLAHVRKIYRLPADMTVAPAPDKDAYRRTRDPDEIRSVIDGAAELLDGQKMLWNAELPFHPNSYLRAYRDETILAVTWDELTENNVTVTYAEVKIADPSQLRRKLCEDSYGSTILKSPMMLADECNAVVASSGDFYRFQKSGIHVYRGELCRCDGFDDLDVCFFTEGGDLLMMPHGSFASEEEVQRFLDDNAVSFSACFGPIVLRDGQNVTPTRADLYPLGEYADCYARTIISQLGELHYLVAVVFSQIPLSDAAELLLQKGVRSGYALDGGQSGTIVLGGEHINPYRYGSARMQSDILYFATALSPRE